MELSPEITTRLLTRKGAYTSAMWRDLLVDRLSRQPELVAAYLFGSQARGTAQRRSDVDVGIWLRHRPTRFADTPFALAGELEAAIGKPVDLVVMNTAPSDLIHRILRDGELLVEHDRSARIQFEVRARNDFFDMARIRDAYRRGPSSKRV